MAENLMEKARAAESVEELLRLAEENRYPLEKEQAEILFRQLHLEGELSDDELDEVSGGCSTKVDGVKYTTVTNWNKCSNGGYERGFSLGYNMYNEEVFDRGRCLNDDHVGLRKTWSRYMLPSHGPLCGTCKNLKFTDGLLGYCGKSGK